MQLVPISFSPPIQYYCVTRTLWLDLLKSNAAARGWLTVFRAGMTARGDFRQSTAPYCSLGLRRITPQLDAEGPNQNYCNRRYVSSYVGWKQKLKRFVTGWVNYYKLADMGTLLKNIDEWMRRQIRMVFWERWKRVRTRYRNLGKLGVCHSNAGIPANSREGYWRIASSPIFRRHCLMQG